MICMKNVSKNKTFRSIVFGIGDAFIVLASGILALLIRFEFNINGIMFVNYCKVFLKALPFIVIATIAIFIILKIYKIMWSAASLREAMILFIATIFLSAFVILYCNFSGYILPRSFYVLFTINF